jgi:hypothetical protein
MGWSSTTAVALVIRAYAAHIAAQPAWEAELRILAVQTICKYEKKEDFKTHVSFWAMRTLAASETCSETQTGYMSLLKRCIKFVRKRTW